MGGGVKRGYKAPCAHRRAFSLGFFGQSRGFPPISTAAGKGLRRPNPHNWSDSQTQTFTTWSGSAKGRGWDPPTLHDLEGGLPKRTRIGPQPFCNLEPLPERTGIRPPTQSFTICQLFPCRRLTADFLLPNSAYKLCHLHWPVGRSRG